MAKFLNDDVAEVCKKHPKRFLGLGTLPMQVRGAGHGRASAPRGTRSSRPASCFQVLSLCGRISTLFSGPEIGGGGAAPLHDGAEPVWRPNWCGRAHWDEARGQPVFFSSISAVLRKPHSYPRLYPWQAHTLANGTSTPRSSGPFGQQQRSCRPPCSCTPGTWSSRAATKNTGCPGSLVRWAGARTDRQQGQGVSFCVLFCVLFRFVLHRSRRPLVSNAISLCLPTPCRHARGDDAGHLHHSHGRCADAVSKAAPVLCARRYVWWTRPALRVSCATRNRRPYSHFPRFSILLLLLPPSPSLPLPPPPTPTPRRRELCVYGR